MAAFAILVSIRQDLWEYYLIEAAFLTLLLAISVSNKDAPRVSWTALLVLLIVALPWDMYVKRRIDRSIAVSAIYENLLRENKIDIVETSDAPFGFWGWKLFDYYAEKDGLPYTDVGFFICYLKSSATFSTWSAPFSKVPPASNLEESELLWSGEGRMVYSSVAITMRRSLNPYQPGICAERIALDPLRYKDVRYPLSNQEWREFIDVKLAEKSMGSQKR